MFVIADNENRRSEKGFSLIELIVVLVILGLLVAVVSTNVVKYFAKGKDQVVKVQINEFLQALELFHFEQGRYPNTGEGLESLVRNPGNMDNWAGPYLKGELPKDPWGKQYVYRCPGTHSEFDLFSFGADGTEGTDDDICSWQLGKQ